MKKEKKNLKNINFGIGQKIYSSIAILIGISIVMAISTFTMVSNISDSTKILVQSSLPQILKGTTLDKESATLISDAQAMATAKSDADVLKYQDHANKTLGNMHSLIDGMEIQSSQREILKKELSQIKEILPSLASNTTQRLALLSELGKQSKKAKELRSSLIKEALPIYDDAEFNLMISLSDLENSTDLKQTGTVIETDISLLSNSLKLMGEINLLAGYYGMATQLSAKEDLVPLKELYTSVSDKIEPIAKSTNSEALIKQAISLTALGKGSKSIFSSREKYLIGLEKSQEMSIQLNKILDELKHNIGEELSTIEVSAKTDGENAIDQSISVQQTILWATILLVILALGINLLYVRPMIVRRLIDIYKTTERIAGGNLDTDIKKSGADELAKMAEALILFRDNAKERNALEQEQKDAEKKQEQERRQAMLTLADQFEEQIGKIAKVVVKAAQQMQDMTVELTNVIQNTSAKSDSVAQAATQASQNVQTVAAASEEMNASVKEILSNITDTVNTSKNCASSAQESQDKLDQLNKAVEEIDAVIQSINDVAEQTNLLALNATIEAARAGDAGKGFAVVANEVKSLANETHLMTDEISKKVEQVKKSARETINSVNEILVQIASVDEKTGNVALAMDEQSNATNEISSSILKAADGTDSVSYDIQDIQQAAHGSATSVEQLQTDSNALVEEAGNLQEAVRDFLKQVRA